MSQKEPLLISACLLGLACRYDGKKKPLSDDIRLSLLEKFQCIPVCPEQLGGLTTPRDPAEKQGARFLTQKGDDVTAKYQRGAKEALFLAQQFHCGKALLKEKSPACGFGRIYDGTFSKTLTEGSGAAADLLSQEGIAIYGENQTEQLLDKK